MVENITTTDENSNNTYKPSNRFQSEIKKLRVKNDLTQEAFADKLAVDVSSVRNWERGRNFPHDSTCERIISFFHPTTDELSALFTIEEKTKNQKEEFLDIPEETALSEALNETTDAGGVENLKSTDKTTDPAKLWWMNFKKRWDKINPPLQILIISASIWLLAWIIIAFICLIVCVRDKPQPYNYKELAITHSINIVDWNELALYFIASFLIIATISVLIYFIIKKVRKK